MSGGKFVELVIRLPAALHAEVKARAEAEDRSTAATVRVALRRYLNGPLAPGAKEQTPSLSEPKELPCD